MRRASSLSVGMRVPYVRHPSCRDVGLSLVSGFRSDTNPEVNGDGVNGLGCKCKDVRRKLRISAGRCVRRLFATLSSRKRLSCPIANGRDLSLFWPEKRQNIKCRVTINRLKETHAG